MTSEQTTYYTLINPMVLYGLIEKLMFSNEYIQF